MASTRMLTWASLAVAVLVVLQLGSPVEGGSDKLAYVKKVVAENKLVIFSKSYCPYCRRAKSVFENMKETPFVIELDERDDGDAIQQALGKFIGRRTVPQVFINGEHIGGSDDTVAAEQSGKLKKLLKASSVRQEESFKSEL
ncbi:hypothetical protein M758_8G044600 [Ceratodon purpureus]|uniref:Glutaredoxin domain-containing protein n=1 Tax=Ceratodon purpureus TaxID=3225 RepID=A0A8T0GZK7_CERPU|nr:hypothetical protein KC19_8G045700 [Ceratodon purpureus]KAG0607641.1 hypothetical protein M758_8G044600 [Ceratodon purpureus]